MWLQCDDDDHDHDHEWYSMMIIDKNNHDIESNEEMKVINLYRF